MLFQTSEKPEKIQLNYNMNYSRIPVWQLSPEPGFGSFGEGYIRISFANSYERIKDAANRIEAYLSG